MKTKHPISPLRAAAARANGAKSRGPVTAAGKGNSSRNAIRHGIYAKSPVIPAEDQAALHQLSSEFHDSLRPRTRAECALVDEMAAAWWSKQRICAMEGARIGYEIEHLDQTSLASPAESPAVRASRAVATLTGRERTLDLLLRREGRYERQFHRALQRLLDLQSRPPEADPAHRLHLGCEISKTSKRTQEAAENNQSAPWVLR